MDIILKKSHLNCLKVIMHKLILNNFNSCLFQVLITIYKQTDSNKMIFDISKI